MVERKLGRATAKWNKFKTNEIVKYVFVYTTLGKYDSWCNVIDQEKDMET